MSTPLSNYPLPRGSLNFYDFRGFEYSWAFHQPFLLSRGYQLRPRYQPGWVGSWTRTGKNPLRCEDALANYPWNVIDAIRVVDNLKVSLKLVPTYTEQIPIALYFSSKHLRSDPRNHCVPVLDYITLPRDDDWGLLVMPFLREFDDPQFEFRGECVEAVGQMLEGLEFMHEHHVAHRDACTGNIMMDTTRLIPNGFHHVARDTHDGTTKLICESRLSVQPMEYFLIDFGLSTRFPNFEHRRLVTGKFGRDKTVPELSETIPYDPFKVDIYQLGGVIDELVKTYHGLRLFRPLAKKMMRADPMQRPSASEALRQFRKIVSKLGPRGLKGRVVPYKEWLPAKLLHAFRIRKFQEPY